MTEQDKLEYPEEWNQLPKHERRKKIKELRKQLEGKAVTFKKIRNVVLVIIAIAILVVGYKLITRKNLEQIEFGKKVEKVSLNGKVKEFSIEGRDHVTSGTSVKYKTNPPTSGSHLADAKNWGVYGKEIDDKAAVHGLEHGGIWISYKEIDDKSVRILKKIGKANSQSVIVSPRSANNKNIVVVSWGRMMELESVDKALIQKYIDTYKNQSPEQFAR